MQPVLSKFLECSQKPGVLSQCNIWIRLLHLHYDIEVTWQKTIKHALSMFYTVIKHGLLSKYQCARRA